jgi:peroxiredoxin
MHKILLSAILVLMIGCSSSTGGDNNSEGTAVGDVAKSFSYTGLDGSTIALENYSGKVLFIFTFGNTCPTCEQAGRQIETEVTDVFSGNEDFAAIGLDQWNSSSSESTVQAFKNLTGISFPLAIQAGDFSTLYQTTYDRLIIIDKEGIIRFKGTNLAGTDLNSAIQKLNELLP